ncbi:MAG: HU family DNA-binding protein [Bacteroidota bacterium]
MGKIDGNKQSSFVRRQSASTYSGSHSSYTQAVTVTKAEVIAKITDSTGIERAEVQSVVETFFEVIKGSMEKGESIYVRGFGSFINKRRAKKVARNISKNTAIVIEEHYIPSFKPSKQFVKKIKESPSLKGR